jgi:hypothetical protein
MGPHDRLAECNGQASDRMERATAAGAAGSSVGSREWTQAAEAALRAAALAQAALPGRIYRVIDGERWYREGEAP